MIKEFCNLMGIVEEEITDRWLVVEKRVLLYATKESRKPVKSLITRFNTMDEDNDKGINHVTACMCV